MKKYIVLFTVLSIICFIILSVNYYNEKKLIEKNAESLIESIFKVDKSCELTFESLTDFEWDEVYVFSAYTNGDYCENVVGSQVGVSFINSNSDMDTSTVFLKNGRAVCYLGGTAKELNLWITHRHVIDNGYSKYTYGDNVKLYIVKDEGFYKILID